MKQDEPIPSWLFDYKMHQENLLYARINIFIVVSSIFLASFATISQSKEFIPSLTVCLLALGVTIIWILNVRRQMFIVNFYAEKLKLDPTFAEFKKDPLRATRKGISGQASLGYWVPCMFIIVWVLAIFWIFRWP